MEPLVATLYGKTVQIAANSNIDFGVVRNIDFHGTPPIENRAVDGTNLGRGGEVKPAAYVSEAARVANIGTHSTGTSPTNTVTFSADVATKAASNDIDGRAA